MVEVEELLRVRSATAASVLLPTHSFMTSANEEWGVGHSFLCSFFCLSFMIPPGAHHIFLGQAWAEGKEDRANYRVRTIHNIAMVR